MRTESSDFPTHTIGLLFDNVYCSITPQKSIRFINVLTAERHENGMGKGLTLNEVVSEMSETKRQV